MPDVTTVDFATLRHTMVDRQVRTFDVTDAVLIDRMNHVPRERFVPAHVASLAYSDVRLTLPGDTTRRTLLTPMILARLIQALKLSPTDRVLDVGGATGYSAAILAGLCASVTALESDVAFSRQASTIFSKGGIGNVAIVTGALAQGWPEAAPFDAILVNGAVGTGLGPLLAQLRDPGRLVCIEAQSSSPGAGLAVLYERLGGETGRRPLFSCDAPRLPDFAAQPVFAF
jgi:protein-L-isoaspartate(D-aspartate) O-methyltransferase